MVDSSVLLAIVVGIIIVLIILMYHSQSPFSSGGLSTINSIALYDNPTHCFQTIDGETVCTSEGLLMI